MHVPFLIFSSVYDELKPELDEAYFRVMKGAWYILGPEVESFEQEYAEYCGVKHCVAVGNCLDALHFILRAVGVGNGDEVIVPSNTYIASWLAVSHAGGTPVPVEPSEHTYNIDPARIEAAITPRTKAIMAVHLYGQPADMDPINEIASRYGLQVVEDNAQAQGARYHGRRTGGLADAAGHSFYPGKNLGAFGDGGAITTNDDSVAAKVRLFRNYGSQVKYHNKIQGYNSRLDELQAAFLRVRLRHLDEWNQRRSVVAQNYLAAWSDIAGLTLPQIPAWVQPVWHLFVIRHPKREQLQKLLSHNDIGTLIHYPVPPHLSGAYSDLNFEPGDYPVAESLANSLLSVPIGPHLSDAERAYVTKTLRENISAL